MNIHPDPCTLPLFLIGVSVCRKDTGGQHAGLYPSTEEGGSEPQLQQLPASAKTQAYLPVLGDKSRHGRSVSWWTLPEAGPRENRRKVTVLLLGERELCMVHYLPRGQWGRMLKRGALSGSQSQGLWEPERQSEHRYPLPSLTPFLKVKNIGVQSSRAS